MGQLRRVLALTPWLKRHGCVIVWCFALVLLGTPGPDPAPGLLLLTGLWLLFTLIRPQLTGLPSDGGNQAAGQMSMGIAMSLCWASQSLCLSNGTPHILLHALLMLTLPPMVARATSSLRGSMIQVLGLTSLAIAFGLAQLDHMSSAIIASLFAWSILIRTPAPMQRHAFILPLLGPISLGLLTLNGVDPTQGMVIGLGLSIVLGIASLKPAEEKRADPHDQSPHALRP